MVVVEDSKFGETNTSPKISLVSGSGASNPPPQSSYSPKGVPGIEQTPPAYQQPEPFAPVDHSLPITPNSFFRRASQLNLGD